MIEFLIFGLFSLGILLWAISQPMPKKYNDARFKRSIENEIIEIVERLGRDVSHDPPDFTFYDFKFEADYGK